ALAEQQRRLVPVDGAVVGGGGREIRLHPGDGRAHPPPVCLERQGEPRREQHQVFLLQPVLGHPAAI
ncbi:MAG: hypothetical protein AVDCRST_MAG08-1054, partial [uncultured Acetobacteraceae bacterium]